MRILYFIFCFCVTAYSFFLNKNLGSVSRASADTSLSSEHKEPAITLGKYNVYAIDGSIEQPDSIKVTDSDIFLFDISRGWGNGKHPTTELCLNFILDNLKKDMLLLDYGTGSGILSILGAKMGARSCIGVEVDNDSLIAAIENCKSNQVDDRVRILHTSEIYAGANLFPLADLTVANILPVRPFNSFTILYSSHLIDVLLF